MKVSVVIPCYNAEPYLAQTIGSVLEQSKPADEIIVVDDGSTDASLKIARQFEAHCPIVRVHSERSGRSARTRNIGAAMASGDALMFLDADDVLGPDVLAALTAALAAQPGAVGICPWRRLELLDGKWVSRPASCNPRGDDQDPLSGWLTGWYHPPCAVLWSRQGFLRTGGWHDPAGINVDGDLIMRALVYGVPMIETDQGMAYYRRMPEPHTSLSGKRLTAKGIAGRIVVIEKIANLLQEHGRLDEYRAPLREAFMLIVNDAAEAHPQLSQRAQVCANRYGPSRLARIMRRRSPRGRRPDAMAREDKSEIRFGLTRAEQVLNAAPAAATEPPPTPGPRFKRPTVSVVIPTYNRADLLPRTLRSVLTQSFTDFEVLVIDDGLSDETAAVVESFGDPRLRYLRQPKNMGVGAARNRGMRESRGAYVALLDDDDEWLPGKLASQVELLQDGPPNVGLVYGGVEHVKADGSCKLIKPTAKGDVYEKLLVSNVIYGGTSNGLLRREVITEVGFFDESLPAIEDYDYCLRISRKYHVDYVDRALSRYYDDRVNVDAGADNVRRSRNKAANLAARARFYEKHGHAMRKAGVAHLFLLESARRYAAHPGSDLRRARALAAKALLQSPTCRPALRLFARTLINREP